MRAVAVILAASAALVAFAEVQTLPRGGWDGLSLKRSEKVVQVSDAAGRSVLTLRGEPNGVSLTDVRVELAADGLEIDAAAALKRGLRKLTLNTAGIDRKVLEGRDSAVVVDLLGPSGSGMDLYFEGHGPKPIGHFYRSTKIIPRGRPREFPLATEIPAGLSELHIRFDILKQPAGKPIKIRSFRYATESELPVRIHKRQVSPELLFKADFDGTANATFAKGKGTPLEAKGLSFEPGLAGQAVRISGRAKSLLRYSIKDNIDPDRGTIALWVKRDWNFSLKRQPWRTLFAFPWPGDVAGGRVGSGALWFWFFGETLRGDQSDIEDRYKTCSLPTNDAWVHLVYAWDEEGVRLFVNGRRSVNKSDSESPMSTALRLANLIQCERNEFTEFTVGSRGDAERLDGLIDDFRIYSAPLGEAAIRELWREHAPATQVALPRPDYAALFAADGRNRYECPALEPGGVPGEMELVEEVRLNDRAVGTLKSTGRLNAVGGLSIGRLGGTSYLELSNKAGSRVAVRFALETNAPLYCFEFDYPDNATRTADLIVQPCRGSDYVLQVGYAAGDEYPNTGKVLTHRCLYWAHTREVAVVLMTARENAPAALSAIRLYRLKSDSLPVAAVREPKAAADGWHRSVALYFEDPAVGYDFGLSREAVASPKGLGELIDRVAATMKYTGENLFAYPGAWYHGLIGDDYNPRNHAPDFLRAWYVKFGKESLGVMPTVNPNTMPIEDGLVTFESMSNGSLHPSEIAIHDTGKPNWGRWHNSPPNFNFHHPKVRAYIEGIIDSLIEQGRDYPAFKGLCMHMTRHCLLWFGDAESGYNDYTVKAFAADCGVDVPFARFAADPLRGKAYATWLHANCWEQWLQWRCDQVTAFYVRMARKLAAVRPDLKLWLNSFVPADVNNPEFARPDYMARANRRCGLDPVALTKAAPNLILCQSQVPADYRWREVRAYPNAAARAHQRVMDTLPGFYSLLQGADYPWVHQHDKYWESAIGRTGGSLSCDWMTECSWRVSTINPSGRHALRHYVQPFRHCDILGLSKGGFLIGTYGMEDVLVPFVRAYRALPAVAMTEIGRVGAVVARQIDFDGRSYFYVVNTDLAPATVEIEWPSGSRDLVSGASLQTGHGSLTLAPYEFRSFAAPSGAPRLGN